MKWGFWALRVNGHQHALDYAVPILIEPHGVKPPAVVDDRELVIHQRLSTLPESSPRRVVECDVELGSVTGLHLYSQLDEGLSVVTGCRGNSERDNAQHETPFHHA